MEAREYQIIPAQSSVDWVGRKGLRSHYGTISVKKGNLFFLNSLLAGGEIAINVRSLKVLDITDPATSYQFETHLNSPDFFYTEEYPDALLEITNVYPEKENVYNVDADLTIRGVTGPVNFSLTAKERGDKVKVTTKITIDRTLYGMKFRSGNFFRDLGDNLIHNDFDLSVNLTAKVGRQATLTDF